MRIQRLALVILSSLFVAATLAAQQSPQAAPRDPQAMNILSQCVAAAGGTQAVSTIQDFTGTGTITYYYSAGEQAQGTVTVKGRGLTQFRLDATLQDGVHSWIVDNGATHQKNPDGSTSPLPSQNTVKPASATFPLLYLLSALQDTSISVSYGGLVTHDGAQVYDITAQKVLPQSVDSLNTVGNTTKADFFIDPKTLVVQSVQDMAYRKDGDRGASSHEMQFSNYQNVSGVLVPFSLTELIAGQKTATIQLNQVNFNSGLADSDFQ